MEESQETSRCKDVEHHLNSGEQLSGKMRIRTFLSNADNGCNELPVPARTLHLVQNSVQSAFNLNADGLSSSMNRDCTDIILKDIKEEPFCMMHTVQQSVIFQHLDFSYITSRIAVMSYPAEGFEPMYKNRADSVREFLDLRHPEHYAVYNVSGRAYSSVKFKAKVHEVGWPMNKAPPFNTLLSLCKSMYLYLRQDPKNVCIIHCLDGKSSSAVLVCAFLIFCKLFKRPEDALQIFSMQRCPVEVTPSQLRYIWYISHIVNNPPVLPHNGEVVVHSISMSPIPLFLEFQEECASFAEVYLGEECIFTSSQECTTVKLYHYIEKVVTIAVTAAVTGDVTIVVYRTKPAFVGNVAGKVDVLKMFQLQFYSGFIPPGMQTIYFSQNELDGICKPSGYPDDFTVSLSLSSSCKVSEPSSLVSKVLQLQLNPNLLFNADEDLEIFTSHLVNKENIAEGHEVAANSEFRHSLNHKGRGEALVENSTIRYGGSESGNWTPNLNDSLSVGAFSVDAKPLNLQTAAPETRSLKCSTSLVNRSDRDRDAFCPSNNFDFLDDIQSLPMTRMNSEVLPSYLNCGGSSIENVYCQVKNSCCLSQDKTLDLGSSERDSNDLFTVGATGSLDHLKANSCTQNGSRSNVSSILSSSTLTLNVSADSNKNMLCDCWNAQCPISPLTATTTTVSDDGTEENQSCLRDTVTGFISHRESTPNLKAFTNNKSDPFAFLENLSSSFGRPTKQEKSREVVHSSTAQHFQNSQLLADSSASAGQSQKQRVVKSTLSGRTPQKSGCKRSHFSHIRMERDDSNARKSGITKPKLDGSEFEDLLKSQGFSEFERKVSEPKGIAMLQHIELTKEVDPEQLKILDWMGCKGHNIRALLCSLHTVLWEGTKWQEIAMHELVSAADVKKCYRKACLTIHPDKHAGTEHENFARLVFMELKDAWSKFEKKSVL